MDKQTFYYSGGSYLRQLQALHQTLNAEPSVQLLLGRDGTGKSALCEKLSQFLRRKQHRVLHFASGVESPELLLIALARQLELPAQGNPAALIEEASHSSDQPIVLIFDDAHLLTELTLLEINRLAQVQTRGTKACSVVLSAEPALLSRIKDKPELSELQQAAERVFVLEPMSAAELEDFMGAFAAEAGRSNPGFTEDAMHLLFKLSKGHPGPATALARDIFRNFADKPHNAPLTRSDLDQLIKNSGDEQIMPSFQLAAQSARPGMVPVAAVLVIASLAFVYQQLDRQPEDQAELSVPLADEATSPFAETLPTTEATAENSAGLPADEPGAPAAAVVPEATVAESSEQDAPNNAETATELDSSRTQLLAAMEQARLAASVAAEAATDSDLVLVTAAERGISADQFALPSYEDLVQSPENAVDPGPQGVADTDPGSNDAASVAVETDLEESEIVDAEQALVTEATASTGVPVSSDSSRFSPAPANPAGSGISPLPQSVEAESPDPAAAVRVAVDAWLQAWQSQDLNAYFQRYHSGFEPRYQDTVADWRQNRQRVIGNAVEIALELSDYQVIEAGADEVEVQFWLAYESGSYQDRTLKKLVLVREDNTWRILEEVNLEVQV